MAVLRICDRRARRGLLLAACTGALALGCSLGARLGLVGGPAPLAFSHRVHYEDEGLDCGDCHPFFDGEEDPGMPVLAQCSLCHDDIDAEKPPERRIETLFDGQLYRAQRLSSLPDEVIFSHPDHALDPELCGTCHTGIEESEHLDERVRVGMDDCTRCHETLGIASDCATCHTRIREEVPPASHAFDWSRAHGRIWRSGSPSTANRCDMCHDERDCDACHLTEPPENHDSFWRLRGHGITARMDRESCATCHRSDGCDSCHMDTRPLNHNGTWGSPLNRHCGSCHLSSRDGGCFVCHAGSPSHLLAAPQPPDHVPGMNCRQCHGISAPLPHVDPGRDCSICHL